MNIQKQIHLPMKSLEFSDEGEARINCCSSCRNQLLSPFLTIGKIADPMTRNEARKDYSAKGIMPLCPPEIRREIETAGRVRSSQVRMFSPTLQAQGWSQTDGGR